jgi:hypothetical protein
MMTRSVKREEVSSKQFTAIPRGLDGHLTD